MLFEREDVTPYECDGLSAYRQVPMVVALPENEEQICAILETCSGLGVPVTARGAGTGLSGGALPPSDGVLLSLARLNRVREIDTVNGTMTVEAGVILQAAQQVLATRMGEVGDLRQAR